jgi:hypothetical protein
VVDGEPAASPTEPGHDLVADHEDVVARADLADALEVAVRRDQDPIGAHDGLEEDGRDRVGALVADDVLEALEALLDRARLLLAPAVGVRVAHDAHEAGLVGPAAGIPGEGHRAEGRAVVGPVSGEDLVPARVVTGELDRVLDGLRPAEGEEDLVEVAGQDLGQLLPEAAPDLGREGRHDVLELLGLLRDRVDDPPIAVADVHRHQLAVEVEDPLSVRRVEVDALGVIDRDRVERALDRPREERVGPVEGDDFLARHAPSRRLDGHRPTSRPASEDAH